MYVVIYFCHFLQNRRKQSSKKKIGRERRGTRLSLLQTVTSKEQLTSASDCQSLVDAGFWAVKEGKVSQRAPSSFFKSYLRISYLMQSQKERREKISPHLNVCKDSNMKKDKKKLLIVRRLVVNWACAAFCLCFMCQRGWKTTKQKTK